MTATILQFPTLRKQARHPLAGAQPLGPGGPNVVGAVSSLDAICLELELEKKIDEAYRKLMAAQHPAAQRWHFDTMTALCRQRERLRIERGLALR